MYLRGLFVFRVLAAAVVEVVEREDVDEFARCIAARALVFRWLLAWLLTIVTSRSSCSAVKEEIVIC